MHNIYRQEKIQNQHRAIELKNKDVFSLCVSVVHRIGLSDYIFYAPIITLSQILQNKLTLHILYIRG